MSYVRIEVSSWPGVTSASLFFFIAEKVADKRVNAPEEAIKTTLAEVKETLCSQIVSLKVDGFILWVWTILWRPCGLFARNHGGGKRLSSNGTKAAIGQTDGPQGCGSESHKCNLALTKAAATNWPLPYPFKCCRSLRFFFSHYLLPSKASCKNFQSFVTEMVVVENKHRNQALGDTESKRKRAKCSMSKT